MRVTFLDIEQLGDFAPAAAAALEAKMERIRAALENYPAAWCSAGEARLVRAPDGWILIDAWALDGTTWGDRTEKARKHLEATGLVALARRP